MKIAIAFEWFLKLVVEDQAKAFLAEGHEVCLVCRNDASEFARDVAERATILDDLRERGARVLEIRGRRLTPAGVGEAALGRLALRRWAPDVVVVHENRDPRLLLMTAGFPRTYTWHDPELHPGEKRRRIDEWTLQQWLRRCSRIVVHSDQLLDHVPVNLRSKCAVIPHGIRVTSDPLPPPSTPTVVFFGKLQPWKGLRTLSAAMVHVWEARPEVRLVVAGDGPSRDEAPDDPRVDLRFGYLPEAAVPSLLAEASLGVLPYHQIAQSGVGSLFVGSGVPIIVTSAGALSDLVPSRDYVVPVGDARELARGILAALDHGIEERRQVLSHAEAHLSWRTVARHYERLLMNAASTRLSVAPPQGT